MANNYSIYFKVGIGGVITSLIWFGVKFGLYSISNFEWLSIGGIILSFILFYHFTGTDKNLITFVSIFCFLLFILLYIFFNRTEVLGSRSSFDFSMITYVFGFSLGTFFLIKTFSEEKKSRFILVAIIFFLFTMSILAFDDLIKNFRLIQNLMNYYKQIENLIVTLSAFLLLIFPVKNIFKLMRQKKYD